jgi:hypothetical protein
MKICPENFSPELEINPSYTYLAEPEGVVAELGLRPELSFGLKKGSNLST